MINDLVSRTRTSDTWQRIKRLHWRDVLLVLTVIVVGLVCMTMIVSDARSLQDEQRRMSEMIDHAENALILNAKGQQVDQAKSSWLFALLAADTNSAQYDTADAAYRTAIQEFEYSLNGLATSASQDEWTQELLHILRRESAGNAALYSELYKALSESPLKQSVEARSNFAAEGSRRSESVSALVQTLSLNFSRKAKTIQAESVFRASKLRMRLVGLIITGLLLMVMLGWYLHSGHVRMHGEMNELEREALTDSLTAMPNLRAFKIALNKAIERTRRKTDVLTLAFIDLDFFKAYNDTQGHTAGDRLLVQAASAWSVLLPDSAVLARIGGEEFAVILPSTSSVEAEVLIRRLNIATPEKQTFSAGISLYTPGEDAASFIARANRALYRAKREGRNRVAGEAFSVRSPFTVSAAY